jgi:hypothetical protein
MKDQSPLKERSKFNFVIYLIIEFLYTISTVFVGFGAIMLIIISVVGELNIKHGQVFALWILSYFPLRYLKLRIEK